MKELLLAYLLVLCFLLSWAIVMPIVYWLYPNPSVNPVLYGSLLLTAVIFYFIYKKSTKYI